MESTQGWRWDVVFAASMALATTAGLFLGLAVLMRPGIVATASSRAELHLVWIVPASAPAPMRTRALAPQPARLASRTQSRTGTAPPRENVTHDDALPAAAGRPLSAVYLDHL